jgi:hypothetical protein
MGWKPKSSRMLICIGKKNIQAARKKVGSAWRLVEEMKLCSRRLKRSLVIKPAQ